MNSDNIKLTIVLTQDQYQLVIEYQKTYEKIFNTKLSLENLFKISLFFSLNINKQKIATLEFYEVASSEKTQDKAIKIVTTPKTQQRTFDTYNKTTKGKTIREGPI